MIERIAENPMAFASGCLLWIPLAIWIVSLLGWAIVGDIEPLWALAGIAAAFTMGYLGLNPPNPMLPPLLLICATATLILAPAGQVAVNKARLRSIDYEAVEGAYEVLRERRDNQGARFRLAKSLVNLGYEPQGIAIADHALNGVDSQIFRDEVSMLRSWKDRQRHMGAPSAGPITCIQCGTLNEVTNVFCSKCDAPFLADFTRGAWVRSDLKGKILAGWLVAMVGIIGIPLVASTLAPAIAFVAIAVILVLMIGVVWWVWKRGAGAQA